MPSDDRLKAYPSLATPFSEQRHTPESTTSSTRDPNSPMPETPGSIRSRTSSFFQSMSLGGGNHSPSDRTSRGSIFSRKGSVFNVVGGVGGRKESISRDYMLETQSRPMLNTRKTSFVPKYAASAHLASMSGRSGSASSADMEAQLRRGSRMMSIVPGEASSPSRLVHMAVPEIVESGIEA